MAGDSSYILYGPKQDCDIPQESMGKYFFELLKNRSHAEVINVDAVTKEVLTCGKLLNDSVKLTGVLKSMEITKGDVISVISENSINYCVPVLAALYMGVTVNPLNPAYSAGELKHNLSISKAKVIFCSGRVLEIVMKVQRELKFVEAVLVMDQIEDNCIDIICYKKLLASSSINIKDFKPESVDYTEDGAFIACSSGTTGLPKGVFITHQNLRESLSYCKYPKYWNMTSEDTTVLVLPIFHMYGMVIYLSSIITSMKVILMAKFRPEVFLKSIQDYEATKLYLAPPLVLFLAQSPLVKIYDISSVKDIVSSAAPVGKQLQDEVKKRLGIAKIRDSYGLTEMSGTCTFQTTDINKSGTVGRLVPGVMAKVWDPDTQKAVGPLKVGEICFKSLMAMKGYVGNAIATRNSFDEDGFCHTGDVGFYDEDGLFYLVARIKEIIKYKGFQVSPSELEALILTHPGVKDSGVIGISDERAGQVPLAFVVRKNGSKVSKDEIVDFVSERISVQKHLYGGVRFIDEIPKTPSGKVLRRKLVEIFNLS